MYFIKLENPYNVKKSAYDNSNLVCGKEIPQSNLIPAFFSLLSILGDSVNVSSLIGSVSEEKISIFTGKVNCACNMCNTIRTIDYSNI